MPSSRGDSIRSAVALLCALATVLTAAPAESAATEGLETILARAGSYVLAFMRELAGIVAEEHYVQLVHSSTQPALGGRVMLPERSRRELKSDLLLVHPEGVDTWIQFRDVFEVDGRPVRDRNDRLVKLFLQPSVSTASRVARIVSESTRYNIGNIMRTVNVPILALSALDPGNQARFKFRLAPTDDRVEVDGKAVTSGLPESPRFTVSTEVWVIQYDEVAPHTIIRTEGRKDLPMHGRFWVEPSTGRVLMTELIAEDSVVSGKIDVSYQSEPVAGLLVPIEMREEYFARPGPLKISGTATYTNFRRFQVQVDQKLGPIKDKSEL